LSRNKLPLPALPVPKLLVLIHNDTETTVALK
jgi:hypothetical protein